MQYSSCGWNTDDVKVERVEMSSKPFVQQQNKMEQLDWLYIALQNVCNQLTLRLKWSEGQ